MMEPQEYPSSPSILIQKLDPEKVRRVIDIRTGHVQQRDCELLSDRVEVICYELDEYGFLIYVPHNECELNDLLENCRNSGYSEAFCDIMTLASKDKYAYILLDRDGPEHENLKKFEW